MTLVLLANLAGCLFMTGVVWFVQIVEYPLFGRVGAAAFMEFERTHFRRASALLAAPMAVEGVAALMLAGLRLPGRDGALAWTALLLLGGAWASTLLLQWPCHAALGRRFDGSTHRRLMRTNWVRTIAWTGRSALLLWLSGARLGLVPGEPPSDVGGRETVEAAIEPSESKRPLAQRGALCDREASLSPAAALLRASPVEAGGRIWRTMTRRTPSWSASAPARPACSPSKSSTRNLAWAVSSSSPSAIAGTSASSLATGG